MNLECQYQTSHRMIPPLKNRCLGKQALGRRSTRFGQRRRNEPLKKLNSPQLQKVEEEEERQEDKVKIDLKIFHRWLRDPQLPAQHSHPEVNSNQNFWQSRPKHATHASRFSLKFWSVGIVHGRWIHRFIPFRTLNLTRMKASYFYGGRFVRFGPKT